MKNISIFILAAVLFFTSCKDDTLDPFAVAKHQVGMVNDSTQVRDLRDIFANDSIVSFKEDDSFIGGINPIYVYEKGGKLLLNITPTEALDSTATISSIRLIDPRYKTEKLVSSASTFKDIKDNYKISEISNLINAVVVSVKDINASFTIDKDELPANMRFDMDMVIDPIQIPDDTKIKYFMVHF